MMKEIKFEFSFGYLCYFYVDISFILFLVGLSILYLIFRLSEIDFKFVGDYYREGMYIIDNKYFKV